jgi:hypothetical protein
MKSKISLLFSSLLLGFFLSGCGGSGDGDSGTYNPIDDEPPISDGPGRIPGFGDTPGEIQGTHSFSLPAGVEVVGEMHLGFFPSSEANGVDAGKGEYFDKSSPIYKYDVPGFDAHRGSGSVALAFRLRNKNATATRVVFPVRLVLKPVEDAQNLILLKEASVTLPPGAEYKVRLVGYCGNANIHAFGTYEFFVVSNSPTLIDLTDRLVDKKINVEEHNSPAEALAHGEIVLRLQRILHDLTDRGIPLSEEDKRWIAALPLSGR